MPFVATFELNPSKADVDLLEKRFRLGLQVRYATQRECLRRLDRMRQSKRYQAARNMPKGKDRNAAFLALRKEFGLNGNRDMYTWLKDKGYTNQSPYNIHLGSTVVKEISDRSYHAVSEYMFGKRGRPKFKGMSFHSIGSQQYQTLRFNLSGEGFRLEWNGLDIPILYDPESDVDLHGIDTIRRHTGSCPGKGDVKTVCTVRVVRRQIRTRTRYFVQVTLEGRPLPRISPGNAVVGLDLGISGLGVCVRTGDEVVSVDLVEFPERLKEKEKKIRRLSRKLDRQRRANNPDNYDSDGQIRRGVRLHWIESKSMKETRLQLAAIHKKMADHRKNLHGRTANEIVSNGVDVRTENVSVKGWTKVKRWRKKLKHTAPATLQAKIDARLKSHGSELTVFPTWSTRLSQTCPACGAVQKRKLSQRIYKCPCGFEMQRDKTSALLASCVEGNTLDADQARKLVESMP